MPGWQSTTASIPGRRVLSCPLCRWTRTAEPATRRGRNRRSCVSRRRCHIPLLSHIDLAYRKWRRRNRVAQTTWLDPVQTRILHRDCCNQCDSVSRGTFPERRVDRGPQKFLRRLSWVPYSPARPSFRTLVQNNSPDPAFGPMPTLEKQGPPATRSIKSFAHVPSLLLSMPWCCARFYLLEIIGSVKCKENWLF